MKGIYTYHHNSSFSKSICLKSGNEASNYFKSILSLVVLTTMLLLLPNFLVAQTIANLPGNDLNLPSLQSGSPGAGKRVKVNLPGYGQGVYYILYLPKNWTPGKKWPVIVEYPGNKWNQIINTGYPDDCKMGYGISAGKDVILASVPFLTADKQNMTKQWWDNAPQNTVDFTMDVVNQIKNQYSGDANNIFVAGFSRGSVATNAIGLYNNTIASVWKGFINYGHYDGSIYTNVNDARDRLNRLNGRAVILIDSDLSQEKAAIGSNLSKGKFTFLEQAFQGHDDVWTLKNIPERQKLRNWFWNVVGNTNIFGSNVAKNKPASQSATAYGGSANKAVDGNTNGKFSAGSVTHTDARWRPSWGLDLQSNQTVSMIKIYNRSDCCKNRLKGARLVVKTSSNQWRTIGYLTEDLVQYFTVDNIQIRKVIVQLAGWGYLSLAEVEVLTPSSSNGGGGNNNSVTNIAKGKPAIQSATSYGGVASRAVDGNTNGNYNGGSVTHTDHRWRPSWSVDLLNDYRITEVKVHNRTDCCSERLKGASVILKTASKQFIIIGTLNGNGTQTIPVNNIEARNVIIQLPSSGILSLAEVEVFGTLDGNRPESETNGNIFSELTASSLTGQQTELSWAYHLPRDLGEVVAYNFLHASESDETLKVIHRVEGEPTKEANLLFTDFIHENPSIGQNYYQVEIEFTDGSVQYSNYQFIEFERPTKSFVIAPNPAQDQIKIDLSNFMDQALQYEITDLRGKVMLKHQLDKDHDSTEHIFLSDFQNGMYIIFIQPEQGKISSSKFMVAKEY